MNESSHHIVFHVFFATIFLKGLNHEMEDKIQMARQGIQSILRSKRRPKINASTTDSWVGFLKTKKNTIRINVMINKSKIPLRNIHLMFLDKMFIEQK